MKSLEKKDSEKVVVLFLRVSTHKQKVVGTSYEDQEDRMIAYCKQNKLNILEIFREDYSAKTFKNRKVFNECLQYLKANKKKIQVLIVTKYDRFSRNRDESFAMIKLINNLGIEVRAIDEPMVDGPSKLLMESIALTLPEVDNQIRSINVKRGMRAAKRMGRYVAKPPFGYTRIPAKTKLDKSFLVLNEETSKLVQEFFNRVIAGESMEGIRKDMFPRGFRVTKSQLYRMIKNLAYMGKGKIRSWGEEKEEIVDTIHPPIINEDTFLAAQRAYKKKAKK
jgi:DNA invertase Pin-like site-specific DNA recombinase